MRCRDIDVGREEAAAAAGRGLLSASRCRILTETASALGSDVGRAGSCCVIKLWMVKGLPINGRGWLVQMIGISSPREAWV